MFTFGSIIESAEQLSGSGEFTFCVYSVVIGKAYCHKETEVEYVPTLKPGYDSVYLEKPDDKFQMEYLVFSPENVSLTHIIRTRIVV